MVIPYLGFYLYFNPVEMILYSPPLSCAIIAMFVKGSEIVPGKTFRYWLLFLTAVSLLAANIYAIVSYA